MTNGFFKGSIDEKMLKGVFGRDLTPDEVANLKQVNEMEERMQSDDFYIQIFDEACNRNDLKNLQALVEYHELRIDEKNNSRLTDAYAKVCILAGNNAKAYNKLERLAQRKIQEVELMGLLSYQMGNYDITIEHLKSIEVSQPLSRVIHALAMYANGQRNPLNFVSVLESVTEKSDLANAMLGILFFNIKDYQLARQFFERGRKIKPKSEFIGLNLLTVEHSEKRVLNPCSIDTFYIATNSRKPEDEVKKLAVRDSITMPTLDLQPPLMYKLAYALLK